MPVGSPAVVLFDIDGTLLRRSGPHHRHALVEAVRRVTGLHAPLDHIPLQGMLDRAILHTMLEDVGVSRARILRLMPSLVHHAQRVYLAQKPPALHDKVCPGARTALRRLTRIGVPMGLVTGNLSRIGWAKLERAGLREFFRFGAFAEMAHDRAGLVRLAMAHARRRGWLRNGAAVWLVGDHQNDIEAARANRIRILSVATGVQPRQELEAHKPDLLFDDLRSFEPGVLWSNS
ncbi:MAG: haloacid dehalogenase-like hydrolase [Bryobacteraceae bacterium]